MTQTNSPIAVIVSDVHYSLNTLQVADAAMRQAINKANQLNVPLVVAGDTHDTKANLRGECVKAMIETFQTSTGNGIQVLIGNHDLINERGKEHSLEFLRPWVRLVEKPEYFVSLDSWLIPYYSDSQELEDVLFAIPEGSRIIMHQGVMASNAGHYIQDKSALPKGIFADFRVISGHYHTAQDIKCGRPRKGAVGLFTYVGNPYTLNFAEAMDPEKGFAVLYDDGTLERIPTNLRKHVILSIDLSNIDSPQIQYSPDKAVDQDDFVWVKIKGTRSELATWDKNLVRERFLPNMDFKLDLIYTDAPRLECKTEKMTEAEIMDSVIDITDESEDQKAYLKALWREMV